MIDKILILLIAVLLGTAIMYIVKQKKRGVKCIGCPAAGTCSMHCNQTSKDFETEKSSCESERGCNHNK